jgi:hypothetical protein
VELVKLNRQLYNITSYRYGFGNSSTSWDQSLINKLEQDLVNAIDELNILGTKFPIASSDINLTPDSAGRDLLNRLHRHFTTGHRSFSYGESPCTWQDNTNLYFTVGVNDKKTFTEQVHKINNVVHQAEIMYTNDRKKTFSANLEYNIIFDNSLPTRPDNEANFGYFAIIKDEHKQYFSDELKYDVWLPINQIQGKNHVVAYLDQDDPTHWDISSNIMYSGSIALGDRSTIKDPAIINWLKSYSIIPSPEHCGMPLGNIISGKEIIPMLGKNAILDIIVEEA